MFRMTSRKYLMPQSDDHGEARPDQQAAEQLDLGRSQAYLRSIIDNSLDCVVVLDARSGICFANASVQRIFGFAPTELLGKNAFDFVYPQEVEDARQAIAQALAGGHSQLECRLRRADGTWLNCELSCSSIVNPEGRPSVAVSVRDITGRRRIEQARAFLASIVESSNVAIVGIAPDGKIESWNRAAESAYGYTAQEILDQPFDLLVPQGENTAAQIIAGITRGEPAHRGLHELRRRCKEGEIITFSVSHFPILDQTGKLIGLADFGRSPSEETRLKKELQEAHAYTRGLIESSVDAMLAVDSNLIITDINERMAALSETPKTMLVGSRFDSLFTDRERAAAGVRQTLTEGAVTNYDLMLRTLGGRDVLVSFNASIFYDAAGKVRGIFAVARDVTEQRRTEQQLREQQSYSRSLIEGSIEALLAVDPDLKITDVNEQTVRLTGYSRAELTGASFPTLFTNPERAAEGVRQTLAEGFVKDYELTLCSAGGSEALVSFSASVFKDAEGRVRGILAAARDIGERQRQEREHSMLASIVTSSSDAIYSYAADMTMLTWNAGAERLLGYSAGEIVGRSAAVLIPLERRGEWLEHMRLLLQKREVEQFETVRRHKDSRLIELSTTMSPILDQSGAVIAVASIGRDITERKRFELELTKARDEALRGTRERSEFLANMSHEVRTPLNSITGMADMLLDTALTAEQQQRVEGIKHSADNLLTIINEILDFSKLSAGKAVAERVDFELEDLVHRTLAPFAQAARRKGLEMVTVIESNTPQMLRGEPDRLRQVLANLLSNALKFTERGEITLRASKLSESPTEASLRFEVRDTGIGIAKQAQTRLFRAFSQADPAIALEYGGTGLGLAIAHDLVQRMGGSIGVISSPGEGSTFWFTAVFGKQLAARSRPSPAISGLQGVRVLIVDDNPVFQEAVKAQFLSWKMAPEVASEAGEALEMLRREAIHGRPYALAMLDIEMPGLDGIGLARQIRRVPEIAQTPVVMLSSAARPANLPELEQELGLGGFLLKPAKASEILDCVLQAVAQSKAGPAAVEWHPVPELAPISGPQGQPLRVLLAEDNAANREVALWQLHKLGSITDAVVNGREALESSAKTPYDVIMMDCRMPRMDGYEASRQIRQREGSDRHTKIVAMTAHALAGDREKCLEAGMDDYLSKPVTVEGLAAVLRRVTQGTDGPAAPPAEPASGATRGTQPAAPEAVLDPATMASLRAKPELFPGLIKTVLAEVPEQLEQIESALAEHNLANAAIAAHSLRGTAKIFGAARMANIAAEIEQAADKGVVEQAAAGLERLKQECERVACELEKEPTTAPAPQRPAIDREG
jgi:two-component system sensor histidine kinase/response regulator